MINLTILNTVNNQEEHYAYDKEGQEYAFMENYMGMGIMYHIRAKFKTEDELKDFMAEVEKAKGSKFKVA